MPRAAPSPSPSLSSLSSLSQQNAQHSQASNHLPNGLGNQPAAIPLVNGLPSGGQQTDLNHLWSVVQQLSQVLEENRAQTRGVVEGVQALQARAGEDGASPAVREVNGEINASRSAAELSALQSQLSTAQSTITSLTSSTTHLQSLIADYESALTLLLDKLRPYAYNQTQAILSLHKHYGGLLETERNANLQLRLEHAEWQAGLGRVAKYARLALESQSDGEQSRLREVKELKEENRVLRRLAGWEERPDDSSDEEEERVIA
ncbi:hypothetical protein BDV96DRAFT_481731 [Lophiotrema nucula]|uniref:Uncharacterized protein n=1 Tax=Lophiotrema nucula TaxID=690887 RepID=A0A6A5ZWG6_9PLEO|nr:hypothetical protein BDV96DRAFT_481731 [Lophiotrema nucula]